MLWKNEDKYDFQPKSVKKSLWRIIRAEIIQGGFYLGANSTGRLLYGRILLVTPCKPATENDFLFQNPRLNIQNACEKKIYAFEPVSWNFVYWILRS